MTTIFNEDKFTNIDQNADVVTLINVFVVEPENQQMLIDLLVKATEEVMCKLPGFISAKIHKSLDGKRVTNYVQWKSLEDFRLLFQNPEVLAHVLKVGKIAKSDPTLYDICYTINL